MALILADNFDRANNTSTVGASSTGGVTPTVVVGTWGINGNQLYSSAVVSAKAEIFWEAGTSNVDVSVVRAAGALNSGGIIFAGVSETDCHMANFDNTAMSIGKWTGTAFVVYKGFYLPPTFALGQTLRVVHKNGSVEAFVDSVSIGRYRLPVTPTGTKVGIYHGSTSHRWDNLSVSDAVDVDMDYDSFLYKGRDTASLDAGAIE